MAAAARARVVQEGVAEREAQERRCVGVAAASDGAVVPTVAVRRVVEAWGWQSVAEKQSVVLLLGLYPVEDAPRRHLWIRACPAAAHM